MSRGIIELHEAGCPADVAKILTGHSDQDVHGKVYLHRENVKLMVLREGLNKLDYAAAVKVLNHR